MERTCEQYASIVRQCAKWMFGTLLNHYLGNAAVVLAGEGPDGTDISISATGPWLEANHVTKMGISAEEGNDVVKHTQGCKSPCCMAAWDRVTQVTPYIRKGQLPGGGAIAIVSAFGGGMTGIMLRRGEGMDDAIDEFKRFAQWFDEKEFDAQEPPHDFRRHGYRPLKDDRMHLKAGAGLGEND